MSNIDNRVVAMHFDNASFESKLADTIKSLDKLRASLDFANSTRGLDQLSAAGKSFNMGGMGAAIDGVSTRFLAMATIGITALSNLVNRAVDAAMRITKAFTIAPGLEGFREYETQLNSVQTILANTASAGVTLDQVNVALQQLNEYSDKTIYNFGQMARNIGTFTAAGVDLNTSVLAIKGIANLAALSGSSAEQASGAMYQLSQAIATGTLRLIDWNSVNAAGIGGEVFKNALFETGKAMGTLANVPMDQTFDQWEKASGPFRNSLSESGEAATQTGASTKAAARQIADAEEQAASSIENADKRIIDATEDMTKVAKNSAREMADAEQTRIDSAIKSAEEIVRAEEYKTETFERSREDVKRAIEDQTKTIEDNAIDVQNALNDVIDAQKRLSNAMKPASADDLQAATDNLTSSQLDQADLADDIVKAERDQQRAAEDLEDAIITLINVEENVESTSDDMLSAMRRVEDAETRVADLADAVERARLRQNAATRSVTEAELRLTEAKQKGTAADQQVIDATKGLSEAQQALLEAREEAADREAAAAIRVKDVEVEASERRLEAIRGVTEARDAAIISEMEADQALADVTERVDERLADSAERLAEAEAEAAKTRVDSAESVARAHESAAERISSAGASASGAASGWVTSDVLTTALATFTGDMTEADLAAKGFTQAQITNILKVAETARRSATEVKTFTQLLGTIKEAIGTGWADSFKLVIGNFTQARELWTNVNNVLGETIQKSSDARNEMLKGWQDFGGRTALIEALTSVFESLGKVFLPIRAAFREIFPRKTTEDLLNFTAAFKEFTEKLVPSYDTMVKIKKIASGFFAIIQIGIEIIKGIIGVVGELLGSLSGVGSGLFDVSANAGDMAVKLNEALVAGGGIKNFFDRIKTVIRTVTGFIGNFKEAVVGIFAGFSGVATTTEALEKLGGVGERVGDRFNAVSDFIDRMSERLEGVKDVLSKVWDYISTWFRDLGGKLAAEMVPGDFDAAVDILNVGLLGGIALMLKKFLTGGFSLDFGSGLIRKISKVFDELKGTLKAMQADLKAKALLKIAYAVGIMTAAMVVLSTIDSDGLSRALIAIGTGMGLLMGAMAIMDSMDMGTSIVKMNGMATSMTILAAAMVILSIAIKNLSSLSWTELAKGLVGAGVGLGIMVTAVNLISADTSGMIRAGIAIGAIAVALNILALALKSFAEMSWTEMGKGLIGAGVGLGTITYAMKFMPVGGMLAAGAAMIPLATGLRILSEAVSAFAEMSWTEMGKGLVGIAFALGIIGGTMQVMPVTLPITAAGVLILSGALVIMAEAVEKMGGIKFGDIVKGLSAFTILLAELAIAMVVMNGTAAGAAALLIVSGALLIMTKVLKELSQLSIGELVTSLLALAGIFVIIGAAGFVLQPVIPALMGLGVAIGLIGGGMALFGAGAWMIAKALEAIAKAGKAGAVALVGMISVFINAKVEIVQALVGAIIEFAQELLDAAPLLIKSIKVLLGKLLDTIIELVPKLAKALSVIITEFLTLVREKYPEILATGIELLKKFLKGISDNIRDIITLGINIITTFVETLIDNMPRLVNTAVDLLGAFLKALSDRASDIVTAGLGLLVALLLGISNNINKVIDAVVTLVTTFIKEIGKAYLKIIEAGLGILTNLLKGIGDNLVKVVEAVTSIIIKFIASLSDNYWKIVDAGFKLLTDFLSGISNNIREVATIIGDIIAEFIKVIGEKAVDIADAGGKALTEFLYGIAKNIEDVTEAAKKVGLKFIEAVTSKSLKFAVAAADILVEFLHGLATAIRDKSKALRDAGFDVASAILEGITFGLSADSKNLADTILSVFTNPVGALFDYFGIFSPSKMFIGMGKNMVDGLAIGLDNDSAKNSAVELAEKVVNNFYKTLSHIPDTLAGMDEFNPVITPVLDLTKVQMASRDLDRLMGVAAISPNVSYDRARQIATTTELENAANDSSGGSGTGEVKFEQNIYSPTALSTNDIYRNTKSQIALAKEELKIA